MISLPANTLPSPGRLRFPHFDKLVHFVIYATFGVLMMLGFTEYKRNANISLIHTATSLIAGLLYGAFTEYMQYCCFSSRHGNIYDAFMNGFGTIFGVFFIVMLIGKRK